MNTLQAISTNTPVGPFHMIMADNTVRASGFGDLDTLAQRLPDTLQTVSIESLDTHSYQAYVESYFDGDTAALTHIPHMQLESPFNKQVWTAMSAIPYGTTVSYKELAAQAGRPKAFRAAGTACGLNRLILLVPCHRVLKSDGTIGNYLYGTDIKRWLLRHEGVY